MKTLAPISWSEGMFLKPHHFQQADLFQDARLAWHLRALDPFHWGVAQLRIDPDALENMVLRVLACEAVLPDGLVVRAPDDAVLDEQSFQDEFPPAAPVLDVYLAVRALGDGGERFARASEARRDVLMRDNEAEIEFLVPRAQLVFATGPADERLAGTQSLRLAQIRRTGRTTPRFELSPHYAPPALALGAAPVLVRTVHEVLERCCAAARTFGQFRRERGPEALGYGVGDFEQLLARQVVSEHAARLQHALANEALHPYAAYGLLAGLRGALTAYFPEEDPAAFPPYAHTDLGTCFGEIAEHVRRLLERLLPVHYLEIPLVRSEAEFDATLDEAVFGRGSFWVLGLTGGPGEDELKRRIDTTGKVSSIDDMRKLVNFASKGVPLKFMPQPPAEIPRYAGWSYFQIDVGDPAWRRVREAGSFAFHLVDAEPGLEGRLFVVLRESERGRR